ncbi:MAG: hypothetical protein ACRDHZ_05080 [Ktedonobacteraceae bacterium]
MEYTEEQEQALKNFREDVLKSLTDLKREIRALRSVLVEGKLTTEADLKKRIADLKTRQDPISDYYAQNIRSVHEVRG